MIDGKKVKSPRRRLDLTDALQEAAIARAVHLGLTAYAVAKATGGQVSEDHVKDFLSRRKSMGSHKLQHVLFALGWTGEIPWM
jgi:hypothetical protein